MKRVFRSDIFAIFYSLLVAVGGVTALELVGEKLWAQIVAAVFAAGAVFLLGIHTSRKIKILRRNRHYRSSRVYFSPMGQMRDSRTTQSVMSIVAPIFLALSLAILLIDASLVYKLPPQLYSWFDSVQEEQIDEEPQTQEDISEITTEEITTEPPDTTNTEKSSEQEESTSQITTYIPPSVTVPYAATTTEPKETTTKAKEKTTKAKPTEAKTKKNTEKTTKASTASTAPISSETTQPSSADSSTTTTNSSEE